MQLGQTFNNLVGLTGLLALAMSASIAVAESNETISIKVKTDDGFSETVSIENLDVGATDVFVTESGKEVLVTREAEGLVLEVDGRTIDVALPKIESLSGDDLAHHRVMFMSDDGEKHVLHGDGDSVFVTEDESVVVEGGMQTRILINGEGLHQQCDSEADCSMKIEIDADHEWVDVDGNHTMIIKRIEGVEGVDLEQIVSDLEIDLSQAHGDHGEQEVIIIKREIELHEDIED